jgi:hypothetical protein
LNDGCHPLLVQLSILALSPVRSADLIRAAEQFESNPFHPIFSTKLAALFDQREPDIVGLSINFMSQALCAFAMIGFIRKQLPQKSSAAAAWSHPG